jgi:hypothetical protein
MPIRLSKNQNKEKNGGKNGGKDFPRSIVSRSHNDAVRRWHLCTYMDGEQGDRMRL